MFGQYAAYIIPSYLVSFLVIFIMAIWIVVQHRSRVREIEALEKHGVKRRSAGSNQDKTQ